jgi:hypothetical protein
MATRAHVVLPDDLIAELDEIVGPRGRSEYIADALREKLLRERQRRALIASAGILADEDIPEWATPELTSEWVSRGRRDNRELPEEPEH